MRFRLFDLTIDLLRSFWYFPITSVVVFLLISIFQLVIRLQLPQPTRTPQVDSVSSINTTRDLGNSYNVDYYSQQSLKNLSEVNYLKQSYQDLINSLKTSTGSAEIKALDSRVGRLEDKENALEQTILQDPDKALTARLLRDKQQEEDSRIAAVTLAQEDLNKKLDTFQNNLATFQNEVALTLLGGVKYRKHKSNC